MVEIQRIIKDTGTKPNRFVFTFTDGTVISVVDSEKLPYHKSRGARAVASVTIESFIETAQDIPLESIPGWVCDVESSTGTQTHSGRGVERVLSSYMAAIQQVV